MTALIYAVQSGSSTVIDMLLADGAMVDLCSLDNGVTPLITAAVYMTECNHDLGSHIVDKLLKCNANPNLRTSGSLCGAHACACSLLRL